MATSRGTRETAGATSARVAERVRYWRGKRGLSIYGLSAKLGEINWPLAPTGVLRIEQNERRCDVDDLMALCTVLNVRPEQLLLPPEVLEPDPPAEYPFQIVNDKTLTTPAAAQAWISGGRPLALTDASGKPLAQAPSGTILAMWRLEAAPYLYASGFVSSTEPERDRGSR